MSRNLADTAAWSVVKIVGGAILAALAIGALLAWLASEAFGSEGVQLAHGDAAWIMADPATRHCCGPQDCHEIDKDRVRYAAGLYVVDGGAWVWAETRGVYPSINANYWACTLPDGAIRCFFAPVMGS